VATRVLIVSTVEHPDEALQAYVGEADTIKVVVPIVRQGVLDWLANDESAYGEATEIARRTADELPGEAVDAVPGEPDIDLAIRDALATFPADEIVVAVHPDEDQGPIESIATKTAPTRSFDGIPVRYVVVKA
jgi:transcription antitermination factor NusA-like protein